MIKFWTLTSLTLALGMTSCRTTDDSALRDAGEPTAPEDVQGEPIAQGGELVPATNDYVQQLLKRFAQDSATAMDEDLEKFDRRGLQRQEVPTFFKSEEIVSKSYVTAKDKWRVTKILCAKEADPEQCLTAVGARSAIRPNDRPEALVDNGTTSLNTLEAMQAANLTEARLPASPWSDDYWAIYTGILGKRYADPNFPTSDDWKENHDYVFTTAPAAGLNDLSQLSPSEKYDLVMGDTTLSMTKAHWLEGKSYYDRTGEVEGWMGICHGWAPAAYMLPRPARAVTLKSAAGQDVPFYPSDIKALGTLLYAKGRYASKFIGGRCNDKDPAKWPNGRIKSQDCFDNNPGSWHMAIVNQIGVSKRSLVLDATFDYEVWNQPILGYKYRYFDPKTKEVKATIAEATQSLPMAGDTFKQYRKNVRAKKIVGVAMDVWYVVETNPSQEPEDTEDFDAVTRVTYVYDLELDANGKIIGGEWYSNKHPDFLWTPTPGAKIATGGDSQATGTWNPTTALPASWQTGGRLDARSGMPLGKFVYQLYQLSSQAQ